ncbi:hypothetical protein SEA_BANTAM_162 [Gordonia phage Bantam]|uniref:Uncharacterized protein n=1 Tax=Gordonia phage Bantam TaxID=1887641 RepID=A0A1B3AYP5_9CAUD|nr:hypothetical protein BIZ77_gp017 [Gordonia phage Bantam]AOE43851.1 hypothetical protein SEA_BANTAM_162 [Gordonia phage Bantam]
MAVSLIKRPKVSLRKPVNMRKVAMVRG